MVCVTHVDKQSYGAILASAGAELIIRPYTISRENAVIRATATHTCRINQAVASDERALILPESFLDRL